MKEVVSVQELQMTHPLSAKQKKTKPIENNNPKKICWWIYGNMTLGEVRAVLARSPGEVKPRPICIYKKRNYHISLSDFSSPRSQMFSKLLEFLQDVDNPEAFYFIFLLCYQFFSNYTWLFNSSAKWQLRANQEKMCSCSTSKKTKQKKKKHLDALHLSGSCDRKITYSVSLRSLEATRIRIKLDQRQWPANLAWQ